MTNIPRELQIQNVVRILMELDDVNFLFAVSTISNALIVQKEREGDQG